jgi:hypothetical protein
MPRAVSAAPGRLSSIAGFYVRERRLNGRSAG